MIKDMRAACDLVDKKPHATAHASRNNFLTSVHIVILPYGFLMKNQRLFMPTAGSIRRVR